MSGSVARRRDITGGARLRPLWRPRCRSRTPGAPSKYPPTLPSLARNSAMVLAFHSLMSNSLRSRSRCMALGGDGLCAGEMRRQELSGSVQRSGRFVKDRVIGLEDVGHTGGDVEGHLDVGGGSLPGEADGVVEENLVRSGLDDQRRQAGSHEV